MYTKESITKTLENLGENIKEPITVYLVGGGALSLRDLKVATKDIDIVVLSHKDLDLLTKAFRELGFENPVHLKEEIYLTALAVFMKEESRIDIFLKEVCSKCGEVFFASEIVGEIEMKIKEKNLWGLGVKTQIGTSGNALDIKLGKKLVGFFHLQKGQNVFIEPKAPNRFEVEILGEKKFN